MTTGPGDESIGDCFEVAALIMVSEAAFEPLWYLVELTRFFTDLEAFEGDEAMARQHAIDNLMKARQWRPVATCVLP